MANQSDSGQVWSPSTERPVPRRPRTFARRDDFLAATPQIDPVDPDRFRSDLDAIIDPYADDPYRHA